MKTVKREIGTKNYSVERMFGGMTKYGEGDTMEAAIAKTLEVPAEWGQGDSYRVYKNTGKVYRKAYHLYTLVKEVTL